MNEFDTFLNQACPDEVIICGIPMNQAETLKKAAPAEYEMLREAWVSLLTAQPTDQLVRHLRAC
jgi:hypothetical protein